MPITSRHAHFPNDPGEVRLSFKSQKPYLLQMLLLISVVLASLSFLEAAEPTGRFAVVDLTAVFEAHPQTKTATSELRAARAAARRTFREESAALKETLQRHQELLRDGRRDEAAAELEKANVHERAIAELGTTNQRNLEEKFRSAKAKILEDIVRVVREFNAERGYAVVLDKSAASANGLPQVLDSPGADDITHEIISIVKN